jgi:hypothetical protein
MEKPLNLKGISWTDREKNENNNLLSNYRINATESPPFCKKEGKTLTTEGREGGVV